MFEGASCEFQGEYRGEVRGGFQGMFEGMMARPDEDIDLARAALYIAGGEYPDLDLEHYLTVLDALGAGARRHIGEGLEPREIIPRLSDYLYTDQGFQGNRDDYYDPGNSYLNHVLDRKTGIPIMLSLVHMEVGKHLGLAFEGIGLPGHFIIKTGPAEEELYVDPFEGGRMLSRADCEDRVRSMFGGRIELQDEHLVPYTRKQHLGRILNNLKHIYRSRGDHRRAITMADMAYMTAPSWGENLKDRAWLHYNVGEYRLAIKDLESYLKVAPGAGDAEETKKHIKEIWDALARAN